MAKSCRRNRIIREELHLLCQAPSRRLGALRGWSTDCRVRGLTPWSRRHPTAEGLGPGTGASLIVHSRAKALCRGLRLTSNVRPLGEGKARSRLKQHGSVLASPQTHVAVLSQAPVRPARRTTCWAIGIMGCPSFGGQRTHGASRTRSTDISSSIESAFIGGKSRRRLSVLRRPAHGFFAHRRSRARSFSRGACTLGIGCTS
jgi:hypothetical protein